MDTIDFKKLTAPEVRLAIEFLFRELPDDYKSVDHLEECLDFVAHLECLNEAISLESYLGPASNWIDEAIKHVATAHAFHTSQGKPSKEYIAMMEAIKSEEDYDNTGTIGALGADSLKDVDKRSWVFKAYRNKKFDSRVFKLNLARTRRFSSNGGDSWSSFKIKSGFGVTFYKKRNRKGSPVTVIGPYECKRMKQTKDWEGKTFNLNDKVRSFMVYPKPFS